MEKVNNGSLCTSKYTTLYRGDIPEGEIVPDTYTVVESDTSDAHVLAEVEFQCGPIKECGVNGVANEDLINMVVDRLKLFQGSKYACEENANALTHLQEALMWLRKRTADREIRGVEGTSNV